MLFNSFSFLLFFLPITIFIYFILIRYKIVLGAKFWLVGASLYFYSYWNIFYLPLILISMAFNFVLGTLIAKDQPHGTNKYINRKRLLIFGISANIITLAYFKYIDFLIDNINYLISSNLHHLNIALPLAISFFTFQQIAYLVDSYKGYTKEYDFLTYILFVSFFPQLIAGPIVSHHEMIPQFYNTKNLVKQHKNIFHGLVFFLIGLFKKIIVADTFAEYATTGFDKLENLTFIGGWFTSLSYTIQIYFDFSGYCDMALGCALFFNIRLPINFNSPYKALNIQDFWKRWHITLSRFLRDYIYIPLGGNRHNQLRTYSNVLTVFLIGGLWHGAAWTFIIWGALHGIANIIYRLWRHINLPLHRFFAWFITFNFVNIAWIFFRALDFDSAKKVLYSMFDFTSLLNQNTRQLSEFSCSANMFYCILLIMFSCIFLPNSFTIVNKLTIISKNQSIFYGCVLSLLTVTLIIKMLLIPYSEFIYFNF